MIASLGCDDYGSAIFFIFDEVALAARCRAEFDRVRAVLPNVASVRVNNVHEYGVEAVTTCDPVMQVCDEQDADIDLHKWRSISKESADSIIAAQDPGQGIEYVALYIREDSVRIEAYEKHADVPTAVTCSFKE